ncbi:MAG: rRNA maturation RNase YbeY [Bacillota bacterium]|nr:rRNA maturation RNase YbeY [Bacillota bacterium]
MEVLIDNRQKTRKIENQNIELINRAVKACLIEENINSNVEVSLSFVNNKEIKELNMKYRGKDYSTDVLSFPLNEGVEDLIILGDIIISIDKVIQQSEEFNHSFERELTYLIIHGMFHLLGYDHLKEEDKIIMRNKEKKIIKELELFK